MPSSVYVGVGDSLLGQGLKAGDLVQFISSSTGGRGGGRPHFASGSIGDPTKVSSNSTLVDMMTSYFEKKS
jgi:alanyl-tRNA synthetase